MNEHQPPCSDIPVHDTRKEYEQFYANPVIRQLAHEPRWSVSDKDKAPVNVVRLLKEDGVLRGAHAISPQCLLPLDELMALLPNAANNAFHLQSQVDGYAVLDIEKTCPPELLPALLGLPNIWMEKSMSGKGYHLLLPLPANFWDYPIAAGKTALQHPDKHYEILLEHWVTFTRKPVRRPADIPVADDDAWELLYASLASQAVPAPTADLNISEHCPEIPRMDVILRGMLAVPRKELSDFKDHSKYHFSVLSRLQYGMKQRISQLQAAYPETVYTEDQQVWLLYIALTQIVPHRAKHEQLRNGMPLLFDRAKWSFSRQVADRENNDNDDDTHTKERRR